jgi:hypothetical protein
LRGRLMVGRLTLDQVVKVRVLAPQPDEKPRVRGAFASLRVKLPPLAEPRLLTIF